MMRPLLVALMAAAGLIGGAHGFKALHVMDPLQSHHLPEVSDEYKGGVQKTKDLQIPKILACTKSKCDLGFAGDFEMTLGTYESKTLMPVHLKIPVGAKEEDVPMASIHFSGDGPSHNSIEDFLVDALTGEVASSYCANLEKKFKQDINEKMEAVATKASPPKKVDKKQLNIEVAASMANSECSKASTADTLRKELDKQREPASKILDGLQILAGDTNISPAKAKLLGHLTNNTDLTGDIAKALDKISCFNSKESCPQKWNVYMANALVGKARTGYSLMNTQIFKSESGKPNYEFDGTLVAVKKKYETESGFRVIGNSSRMGDASTTRQEILDVPVKNAFTFSFTDGTKSVVDVDAVTTGSVFLDHAVIEFEIWNHKFVVLNVASIVDVRFKGWGAPKQPFYQWFDDELIDGIKTMKVLDQMLYEKQKLRLEGLYDGTAGLSDAAKQSLKKVFKEDEAKKFNGMETLKGDTDGIFYAADQTNKCTQGDLFLVRDELVQGMVDFVHAVAGTCDDISSLDDESDDKSPASSYFNAKSGTAKKNVCTPGNMDAIISAWKAAAKKKKTAKDILKFTGEQLAKKGFYQPYGGFGDAVSDLSTNERKVVSPREIYKIVASIAKKGKVIVGSEISVARIIPKE